MVARHSSTAVTGLAVALIAALATACSDRAPAPPTAAPDASLTSSALSGDDASYLVLARGDRLPRGLERAVERAGGSIVYTVDAVGVAVATSDAPDFAARAGAIRGVQAAIPNPELRLVPSSMRYERIAMEEVSNPPTSGDDDFLFDLQWGLDAVDAPEAWDAGATGAGVRVAILDSGIDADHPDLAPNLNAGLSTSFVPGEAYDELPPGFNHGTHVAGIAAAADNAFGTIGVAPEAEIVAVKVLSAETGSGSFGGVIAGIVYAADNGADVINMSLGAYLSHRAIFDADGNVIPMSAAAINHLLNAIGRATSYAHKRGATVIASAGNDGVDGDRDKDLLHIPSDAPYVLSISATGPKGWGVDPSTDLDLPSSSFVFTTNSGQSVIAFAAPGGNLDESLVAGPPASWPPCVVGTSLPILNFCYVFDWVLSTTNGGWAWAVGTSMAAPHASGVAAIIIGENGGSMHPSRVEAALRRSADDLGKPGNDDFFGDGRVNAGNAVD